MFTKELIAPCGLNCGICSHYLRKESPCCGCRINGSSCPVVAEP